MSILPASRADRRLWTTSRPGRLSTPTHRTGERDEARGPVAPTGKWRPPLLRAVGSHSDTIPGHRQPSRPRPRPDLRSAFHSGLWREPSVARAHASDEPDRAGVGLVRVAQPTWCLALAPHHRTGRVDGMDLHPLRAVRAHRHDVARPEVLELGGRLAATWGISCSAMSPRHRRVRGGCRFASS
jgi:hypothetical protein